MVNTRRTYIIARRPLDIGRFGEPLCECETNRQTETQTGQTLRDLSNTNNAVFTTTDRQHNACTGDVTRILSRSVSTAPQDDSLLATAIDLETSTIYV